MYLFIYFFTAHGYEYVVKYTTRYNMQNGNVTMQNSARNCTVALFPRVAGGIPICNKRRNRRR